MIRVLLVDDQALVRAGFRAILSGEPDIEVVAEADDGEQAVVLTREHRPTVVVMDLRMPGCGGLEATRRIAADAELAGSRVVVLTTFDADEHVYDAMRAGASGFLVKDAEPADLLHGVRVVARGEALLSPSVTLRFVQRLAAGRPAVAPSPRLHELTPRETDVVTLVARGASNGEIATRLVLSPATVKTHVSRIMTKLGVRDRAQLVVLAYESGIVTPEWIGHPPAV